jgi:hypothetical protein
MAGFETVVRPAVVPNIRPSAAQKVVAFDDPGQGFAIIHGNPAKQLNLTTTTSVSISRNNGQEVERRVDRMRVYQVDESGNVNKGNFVDVEVANRLRVKDPTGRVTTYYRPAPTGNNIEMLQSDIIYTTTS